MADTLTYDEAVACLGDGDRIHTFRNPAPSMMLGADWDRVEVLDVLKKAAEDDAVGVSGPMAQATKHGLVVVHGGQYLFIETTRRTDGEQAEEPTDGND